MVTEPTRTAVTSANVLDLILTTTPNLLHSLTCFPGVSDHCCLQFTLNIDISPRTKVTKTIRNYKKGDYAAINTELEQFIDSYMPGFFDRSVEQNWCRFRDKISLLIDRHVPLQVISKKQRSPWFTVNLKRLLNKKKRLFRSAKLDSSVFRWKAYHESTLISWHFLKLTYSSASSNTDFVSIIRAKLSFYVLHMTSSQH